MILADDLLSFYWELPYQHMGVCVCVGGGGGGGKSPLTEHQFN